MNVPVLPQAVRSCLDTLEQAGFPTYAVGGCVRDSVLGLTPHDYDLCSAALPDQMKVIFSGFQLVLAGEKHGTVGVVTPEGVVEITTFRTEGGYTDNRHPNWVRFVPNIEDDLARRDFTVNAMAWSPYRGFADPFGGQEDLKNHILRAVGHPETRFREDSLRILRGVRFAVRYGLKPESETLKAMKVLGSLMDNLARERVFDELCKLLPLMKVPDLQLFAPILTAAIPELAPTLGFEQHTPHHIYDVYTHTAHVIAGVSQDLTLRWTALLHDLGKVPTCTIDENGRGHFLGHAQKSAEMADVILRRLKAPTALREQVVLLIRLHMTPLEPDPKLLRRRLRQHGTETVLQLHAFQRADYTAKGTGTDFAWFDHIDALLEEILSQDACLSLKDLAINGHDLMTLGFQGPAIGQCLNALLDRVLDGALPNETDALLNAAKESDNLSFKL